MRTQIRVSCIDQQLKVVYAPILASGGLNEAEVVFDFCEKWDGFAKTGVFYRDEENVYYSLLDENDTCIVPHEVYDEPGTFYFTVIGDRDGIRRTAITVRYKAQKGVVGEGMIPSDPTPDVYDQIINLMTEVNEKVDSGAMAGPQGEPGYTPVKGVDYFDGYTPVKGVDYFDGEKGADGYTPIKGIDYFDGKDGKDGAVGQDGTSVTITNISESTEDGGNNVVTFSDGSQLTVKNGSKGDKGDGTYDPLIVTGSPEVKSMAMSGTNFAIYNTSLPLSHTGEEIYNAFNSGRDVYVRLSKGSYNTNLGTSKTLPDIQYVDARVVSVSYTGMNPPYNFVAHGEGFSNNVSTGFYRVYVSEGATSPQIQAYWYKPTTA